MATAASEVTVVGIPSDVQAAATRAAAPAVTGLTVASTASSAIVTGFFARGGSHPAPDLVQPAARRPAAAAFGSYATAGAAFGS